MASAAEQMAANLSWGALGKATDLRQRIFFTIGLLIVYRLGTYIPVPGIDGQALREFMTNAGAGLGGILNMFTGGAISRMGIFALGIMPYISASIIVQLLASMLPSLEQLKNCLLYTSLRRHPRDPRSQARVEAGPSRIHGREGHPHRSQRSGCVHRLHAEGRDVGRKCTRCQCWRRSALHLSLIHI